MDYELYVLSISTIYRVEILIPLVIAYDLIVYYKY